MMIWRMNCTTKSQPNCKNWPCLKSTLMVLFNSSPPSAPRLQVILRSWITTSRRINSTPAPRDVLDLHPWMQLSRKNQTPLHLAQPTSKKLIECSLCMKANASTARSKDICLLTAQRNRSLNWRSWSNPKNCPWNKTKMTWKMPSLETSLPSRQGRCWCGGNRSQQTIGQTRFSCW